MNLKVNTAVQSPNFSDEIIHPEFVVLHYTACDLKKTLEIFSDPEKKVCSHFVIAEDGTVFDLGSFLEKGSFKKGAHAGRSHWKSDGKKFEGFNQFSIGIELVNLNGNVFEYPQVQMDSLAWLLKRLVGMFKALNKPSRIVGHEDIAGFRGKCDPGLMFPWKEIFEGLYPGQSYPKRKALMTLGTQGQLKDYLSSVPAALKQKQEFWTQLSFDLEQHLSSNS